MPESMVPPRKPSALARGLIFLALLAGALVVLVVLACLFESWRGRRNWEAFRSKWEAKGEHFDLAAFVPKQVPDDQNFATTPLLAHLLDNPTTRNQAGQPESAPRDDRARAISRIFEPSGKRHAPPVGQWQAGRFTDVEAWRDFLAGNTNFPPAGPSQDPAHHVLVALRRWDPELDELAAASARPSSVFPIHYENVQLMLPHLSVLKGIAQTVRLRAVARLAAGQKAGALQDVRLGLRLAGSIESEPLLISQLVRISMLQQITQPIWEGLAHHSWTAEQLADLQSNLGMIRLLEDYGRTIRAERALGNVLLDEMRTGRGPQLGSVSDGPAAPAVSATSRFVPGGWYYHNQLALDRLYQERCLPVVDAAQHRVFPSLSRQAEDAPELRRAGLYNIFARLLYPAVGKTAMKFAYAQSTMDMALVACALERHRLDKGQYPEQLTALVPGLLATIPPDLITGQPLHYQRTAPAAFTLYSVGWNETDEGGEVRSRKPLEASDPNAGDWVWRYPPE